MSATDQHPDLSSLPTPPIKKRRRPALACEQCRRRKIRCDRNVPCNHCAKSNSSTCSYVPTHVPASWAKRGKGASDSKPRTTPSEQRILPVPDKDKSTPSSSEYIHPQASQFLYPVRGSARAASSISGSGVESQFQDGARDVDWLKARIHHLEEKLSRVEVRSGDEDDYYEKSPAGTESTVSTKGTVAKTRYFGRSHWMNGAALVSQT